MQGFLQRLAVRPRVGLAYEHMFPRLRQQLLARVDLLVELSTLGEYGVDDQGRVMTLDPEPALSRVAPRVRDRCADTAPRHACGGEFRAPGRAAPARP